MPPNIPLNGNGLVQLIIVGNSIRLKWVNNIRIQCIDVARSKAVLHLLLLVQEGDIFSSAANLPYGVLNILFIVAVTPVVWVNLPGPQWRSQIAEKKLRTSKGDYWQ